MQKLNSLQSFTLLFSRIFVGALFIFSGLIKLNDPLGFGYKLQEYFEAFKLHFLVDYATSLAIILCVIEIVLGLLLILGMYAKKVTWGLLLMILFFSILTFSTAVFKIVTSCGCFGDAIPLTPWQSFIKDLILLFFILILFKYKNHIQAVIKNADKKTCLITTIITLILGIFTYSYGPIIDFLPYKKGAHIPSLMKIPTGASPDQFEIKYQLKNKKTGAEKQVTDKDYLATEIWKDQDWEIVGEPIQKLIKKGFQIKIKDLKITDATGNELTDGFLNNPFPIFWVIAYDLHQSNSEALIKLINQLKLLNKSKQTRFILITTTAPTEIETQFPFLNDVEVLFADAVPLKSMVRSNPGVLLIQNGTILNKWTYLAFPNNENLNKNELK